MGDNPIWELHSGYWIQDDKTKRFEIADPDTKKICNNQFGLDVIVSAKWHSVSESDCKGFFPPEFTNCPFCGKFLNGSKLKNDIWIPPFGDRSGLRLLSRPNQLSQSFKENRYILHDKEVFRLPRSSGDYQFIVASLGAKLSVLITFDRTTGLLDYYSPAQEQWISLDTSSGRRIGRNHLPNWSWSVALVNDNISPGIAIPTKEGPVWVTIDWANKKYASVIGQGECIGGAATLETMVFVPILIGNSIAINYFDPKTSQWAQIGDLIKKWDYETEEGRYFSVPIIDLGRQVVYWIGSRGLITLDVPNQVSKWRPWETDAFPCRAIPELGPPYRDSSGDLWQLCYDTEDPNGAFRYYKLSGDENDREDARSGAFSSGISCYTLYYDLWYNPWEKIDERLFEKAKQIRVPLLCLDDGESKSTITVHFDSGIMLPLLKLIEDKKKKYTIELRIESPNDPFIELKTENAFNTNAPWDLKIFIYRECLYVYSAENNVCYKWRLT